MRVWLHAWESWIACWFCFDFPSCTSIVWKCQVKREEKQKNGAKQNRNVNNLRRQCYLTLFSFLSLSLSLHVVHGRKYEVACGIFNFFNWIFCMQNNIWNKSRSIAIDSRKQMSSHGKLRKKPGMQKMFDDDYDIKNWRTHKDFLVLRHCLPLPHIFFAVFSVQFVE